MEVDFLPTILIQVVIVLKFVAGPAIKKTNAAPMENPLEIIAKAIGIDAAAHTYIGILTIKINIIDKKLFERYILTNSLGINEVIIPAISNPKIRVCPISFGKSYNPYFKALK